MKKKYLLTLLGMFPSYKTFFRLSELSDFEKQLIREDSAKLFKVFDDGIFECGLNGKKL